MTLTASLYFSFRSPYSALAIGRYCKMAEDYDLAIALRPVWPLAVREPDFFERNHPNWINYTLRDIMRVARMEDIPFGAPRPDPIIQDMKTRKVAAEQPYIKRITRLGQAAARRGRDDNRAIGFAKEVAQLIWGGADSWHEGDHLAKAAESVGFDFAELEAEALNDAEALDDEISTNQNMLEASGHWGVPTLVFDGEPFFGQDRIRMAQWRMEHAGLKAR